MADMDLISAIYNQELSDKITVSEVRRQSRFKEFWLADSDGLDLMHHAILAGNEELVFLLNERLNQSDDEMLEAKQCSGYLHLACLLGNDQIVACLCEGPLVDIIATSNTVCLPRVDTIQRHLIKRSNFSSDDGRLQQILDIFRRVFHQGSKDPVWTIIDIAAMAKHVECVRVILKSSVVQYVSKRTTLLERALELGSLEAFQLLLTQNPDSGELHAAYRMALSEKQLRFVTILLDHGINVSDALNGINPYHFVYMRSVTFSRQRVATNQKYLCGIDELTSVLIERGFDVNDCNSPGTFPLYSLLASLILEKDHNPGKIPVSHIQTLDLLLRAGAATNVDEIQMARSMNVEMASMNAQAGRELASSALHAYFYGLQGSDTWRPHIAEHLDRICLSLLEHGASASAVQVNNGSTALHDLMQATATQHAQGHMHADLSTMSRFLLYYGADPNAKNLEGQYPVEVYFVVLLRLMGGLIAFRRWKSSENAAQVIHILYFMDTKHASKARLRILEMLQSAQRDGMPSDVYQFVEALTDTYVCTIKSLQELTKLVIWKAVHRRMAVIRQIHMPRAFAAGIADLFSLDLE